MVTCWKCRSTLRVSTAAFCPQCGARQQGGHDADRDSGENHIWDSRIRDAVGPSRLGSAIVWTILFPLAPLVFPFWLMSAGNRLRNHVRSRLSSPALHQSWLTASREGRLIYDGLAESVGRWSTRGWLPLIAGLILWGICTSALFLVPADAPEPIRFDSALEGVLEARPAYGAVSIRSLRDYERFWSDYPTWAYDDIRFYSSTHEADGRYANPVGRGLTVLDLQDGDTISSYNHPPYEYLKLSASGDRQAYRRVTTLYPRWNQTEDAGIAFWLCAGLYYLVSLVFGLIYWVRFARHREAEVLAAAFAVRDPDLHDRLRPVVRKQNALLYWVAIPLAISGLQIVLFPLVSALVTARHARWERQSGIAGLLLPVPEA